MSDASGIPTVSVAAYARCLQELHTVSAPRASRACREFVINTEDSMGDHRPHLASLPTSVAWLTPLPRASPYLMRKIDKDVQWLLREAEAGTVRVVQ